MENENSIIDMIPPGKALDSLIWERVFDKTGLWDFDLDVSMLGGLFAPFLHSLVGLNEFSTSDIEAMFVLQAIIQKDKLGIIEVQCNLISDSDGELQAWVKFFNITTGRSSGAPGKTIAHAICLAALKYVGLGDYEGNGVWPGRKVYAVRFEDPPALHEGRIVEGYSNRGTFTAEFAPDDQPPYETQVTQDAIDSGTVAFTPEAAIKHAFKIQFDVARSANKDALRASEKLALIKKLSK